jgi:hypothetical protein
MGGGATADLGPAWFSMVCALGTPGLVTWLRRRWGMLFICCGERGPLASFFALTPDNLGEFCGRLGSEGMYE